MGLINSLDKLNPQFQSIANWIIARAADLGVKLIVNETLRTQVVQAAYYAQGRRSLEVINALRKNAGLWSIGKEESSRIITNVATVNTQNSHGAGLAMDVVPNGNWNAPAAQWAVIGQCVDEARVFFAAELARLNASLVWGGDWRTLHDTPHVEMVFKK